ncbi:hypothetical protein EDB86DRAFT_454784 [Lactarius hatsudake]|nr:hypothetical protein EDB86DRAFT_454784 [Lactarius hatsudake]
MYIAARGSSFVLWAYVVGIPARVTARSACVSRAISGMPNVGSNEPLAFGFGYNLYSMVIRDCVILGGIQIIMLLIAGGLPS